MSLKRYELWPDWPIILVVHADTDKAKELAEILQVKLEIHGNVTIIDLTNYNELRSTIIEIDPDLVILGDFADFEPEERITRAIEHAALLAFKVNPHAIVIHRVAEKPKELLVGVDLYYVESEPIEKLIEEIKDID